MSNKHQDELEPRASSSSEASPFKDPDVPADRTTSVHSNKHKVSAVRDADASSAHEGQQPGVSRIEALYRVFPRNHPVVWLVYASLAAVAIVFSLDQSTTAAYQLYATRTLGNHAKLFGIIATVEAIISKFRSILVSRTPSQHSILTWSPLLPRVSNRRGLQAVPGQDL